MLLHVYAGCSHNHHAYVTALPSMARMCFPGVAGSYSISYSRDQVRQYVPIVQYTTRTPRSARYARPCCSLIECSAIQALDMLVACIKFDACICGWLLRLLEHQLLHQGNLREAPGIQTTLSFVSETHVSVAINQLHGRF